MTKEVIQREIDKRQEFLDLHNQMGDGLLEMIQDKILSQPPEKQREVMGIIAGFDQNFCSNTTNQSFELNLKNLRVETVYRVWRDLFDTIEVKAEGNESTLPSLTVAQNQ